MQGTAAVIFTLLAHSCAAGEEVFGQASTGAMVLLLSLEGVSQAGNGGRSLVHLHIQVKAARVPFVCRNILCVTVLHT